MVPYLLICAGGCAAAIWRIVLAWWLRDVVKREEKSWWGYFSCVSFGSFLKIFLYIRTTWSISISYRGHETVTGSLRIPIWTGGRLFYVKEYIEENDLHNSYLFYFGPPELPDAYGVPHQTFRGKFCYRVIT